MAEEPLSASDRQLLAHALAWQTLRDITRRVGNGGPLTTLIDEIERKSFLQVNAADVALPPEEPHPHG